jgi:hypothetical protein
MRLRVWMVVGLAGFSAPMLPGPTGAIEEDTGAIRCGVLTLRAAAREVREKAQCHERALRLGRGVDPNCLSRAEEKSARLLDRADPAADCFDRVARGRLRASVDRFLIELVDDSQAGKKAMPNAEKKSAPAPTAVAVPPVEKKAEAPVGEATPATAKADSPSAPKSAPADP